MTITQSNCEKPDVVTFLTRVVLSMHPDILDDGVNLKDGDVLPEDARRLGQAMQERASRVAAMMELLERLGFAFSAKNQIVTAYSNQVEAYEVKRELINAGFADREFQIILEYTRGWGML